MQYRMIKDTTPTLTVILCSILLLYSYTLFSSSLTLCPSEQNKRPGYIAANIDLGINIFAKYDVC